MNVIEVDLTKITRLDNSRSKIKDSELTDLMKSIQQIGLLSPLVVRPSPKKKGEYVLLCGNRRFHSLKKLGYTTAPCAVFDNVDTKEDLLINLSENIQRKDISMFDMGRYCYLLKNELDMTTEEVAVRLGVKSNRVKAALETYKYVPKKYASKVVTRQAGGDRVGVPATIASMIVNMKRKFNLKSKEIESLFEVAMNQELTTEGVRCLMTLMDAGLTIKQALKMAQDIVIIRPTLFISKEDHEKIRKKFGTTRGSIWNDMLCANSLVKLKNPLDF